MLRGDACRGGVVFGGLRAIRCATRVLRGSGARGCETSLSTDAKFPATHLLSQYRRTVQAWSRLFLADGELAKATMRDPSLLHASITLCRPPSFHAPSRKSSFPPLLPPNAHLLFSRAELDLAFDSLAAPSQGVVVPATVRRGRLVLGSRTI